MRKPIRKKAGALLLALALGSGCGGSPTGGAGAMDARVPEAGAGGRGGGAGSSAAGRDAGQPDAGSAGGAGGGGAMDAAAETPGGGAIDGGSCPLSSATGGGFGEGSFSSCEPGGAGMTNCGAGESCCTSLMVPGGTFFRTYGNGPSPDFVAKAEGDPATISSFRLDKYDVTVGRFRQFVNAWKLGYVPAAGAGKHAHLNQGSGLNATAGGNEPGWRSEDNCQISPTDAHLRNQSSLVCPGVQQSWKSVPGPADNLPINCVNWWEAYAFCIWDGGFLPSEAEWEFAAAGGAEQNPYAWGKPAGVTGREQTNGYFVYQCHHPDGSDCLPLMPVGSIPKGAGRWGQLDLTGQSQWVLDWYQQAYAATTCLDCAKTDAPAMFATRARRGASTYIDDGPLDVLHPTARLENAPETRWGTFGFRCARSP